MVWACRLHHLSVGLECVQWQNGRLYPDAVWGGEWGGPRIDVLDVSTCLKGKVLFLGFFGICTLIGLNGQNDVLFAEKCI